MADDMGVETLGCYGGASYRTPRLDRLAAEGARFSHAYATPLCANTRVQLMTGLYNNRNWTGFGLLPKNARTFGHALQAAGYTTCVVGKWQLHSYDPPDFPGAAARRGQGMEADDAGFDEYCLWHAGHTETKGSRYANPTLFQNGRLLEETEGKYGPDIWADYLCDFIKRHKDTPFFAYYPMALPHWPFVPTPASPEWRTPAGRMREDLKHARDMIEYVDRIVGRVVDAVDESGLGENTLILFYADNGTDWRVASLRNGRLVRGGKGSPTDAGTRAPLIARWTGVTPAGVVADDLIDSTDFLPTLNELAGAPAPEALDGRSFAPRLRGRGVGPREWVYMHQDPRPGWDKERFWLVRFARTRDAKLYEDGRLYDTEADPAEDRPRLPSSDTAATRAARLRLQKVLDAMKPYPRFDPASMRREAPAPHPARNHRFQEREGVVIAEAEAAPLPEDESWRAESSIPGGRGWGYLRALRDQEETPRRGALPFRTKLASSGLWRLAVRHRSDYPEPGRQASFWLRVNEGPWMACRSAAPQPGEWGWDVVADHPEKGPTRLSEIDLPFRLRSGGSTYGSNAPVIWIAPKSDNLKIDRIALYQADRAAQATANDAPPSEFHPW